MNWSEDFTNRLLGRVGFYKCKCCGRIKRGPPLSYFLKYPEYWFEVPESEREKRSTFLNEGELCQIDQHCFVKGNVQLPIRDSKDMFAWTVWVSLSPVNFQRALQLWDRDERTCEPPYFGWLSTALPGYPESTVNLKTHLHFAKPGDRSRIELEPTNHPLAVEQREGITMNRVKEFAAIFHQQFPS